MAPLSRYSAVGILFALGLIFSFLAQSLAFRVLGVQDYGLFSVLYNVCAICSVIGAAGFDVSALRYFATLEEREKALFYATALRTVFVATAAISGLILAVGLFTETPLLIVGLVILGCACWSLVRLFTALLRAEDRFNRSLLIDRPVRDGLISLTCGGALLVGLRPSLEAVAALIVLGGVIGVLLALPVFRAYRINVAQPSNETGWHWLSASFGLLLINALQLVISRIDVVWISAVAEPDIAGLLNVLITISDIVIIPSSALLIVVMPKIAKHYNRSEHRALTAVLLLFAVGSFLGALAIGVLMLLFPDIFILLFGHEAAGRVNASQLHMLVLAKVVMTLLSAGVPLLLMSGKIRGVIFSLLGVIAAKMALMPWVTSEYGLTGGVVIVAGGSLALGIAQSILALWAIRERLLIGRSH